jgi:hypothetical protein
MYKSTKEMYKSVVSKRKRIHQLFQRKRTMPARVQTSLLPLESGRPSRAEACRSDLSTAIAGGAGQRPTEVQNLARGTRLRTEKNALRRDQNALPRDLAVTVSPPARQALASLPITPILDRSPDGRRSKRTTRPRPRVPVRPTTPDEGPPLSGRPAASSSS